MAAWRLQCWGCGAAFYGRADARYCCGACRQKAHRARTSGRTADKAVPAPDLSHTIAEARQIRTMARTARAHAEATRRATSATRAAMSRPRAN